MSGGAFIVGTGALALVEGCEKARAEVLAELGSYKAELEMVNPDIRPSHATGPGNRKARRARASRERRA